MRVREKFAALRSRYVHRALDAVLTAGIDEQPEVRRHLARVFSPSSSHYERVRSLVRATDFLLPGLHRRAVRRILDLDRVPLTVADATIHSYGSGGTVFRIRTGRRDMALKVYRLTLGLPLPELRLRVRRYLEKLELYRSWFGDLCLPTTFFILHSPVRGMPAVASLQPFLAPDDNGRLLDPLSEAGGSAFVTEARKDEGMARDFDRIVHRVRDLATNGGRFPDLIGEGNLIVAPAPSAPRLRLVDFGVFEPGTIDPERIRASVARLERLSRAVSAVDRAPEVLGSAHSG